MADEENVPFILNGGPQPEEKKKRKKSDAPKEDPKPYKLYDPMSLATWARLRSAGAGPDGAKPLGAENMDQNPNVKRDKARRKKMEKKRR